MGATGRLVISCPSNRYSVNCFGLGRGWQTLLRARAQIAKKLFGDFFCLWEIQIYWHHVFHYLCDVLAPFVGWRFGQLPGWPAPSPALFKCLMKQYLYYMLLDGPSFKKRWPSCVCQRVMFLNCFLDDHVSNFVLDLKMVSARCRGALWWFIRNCHVIIGPYTSIALHVLLLILTWNNSPNDGAKFLDEASTLRVQLLIYVCFY